MAVDSIRGRLRRWSLAALSLGGLVLLAASYFSALRQMNDVFDAELKQVALTVLLHAARQDARDSARGGGRDGSMRERSFVTQVWTREGGRLFVSVADARIPFEREAGLRTVTTGDGRWRVHTARSDDGTIVAQAAQPLRERSVLATQAALRLLLPTLIVMPFVWLAIAWALDRGLAPLERASREVESRSTASLDPIDPLAVPQEIRPLAAAVNTLAARLDGALSAQRRFTADAAHELRTPLAALSLQLSLLDGSANALERDAAMRDMRRGLERANRMVEQLLVLSRLDPDAASGPMAPVDLAALAAAAVVDFDPIARQRGIDLGMDADGAHSGPLALVLGDADQLRVLLDNLLDNEVRYVPPSGRVDVRVTAEQGAASEPRTLGEVVLEVRDDGPGIGPDERGRVFDRFYRGRSARSTDGDIPGTGLGLAIVRTIAERHGAAIELDEGLRHADGRGAGFALRLRFPAHVAPAGVASAGVAP